MKDIARLKSFIIKLKDQVVDNKLNEYIYRMKGKKYIDETIVKI